MSWEAGKVRGCSAEDGFHIGSVSADMPVVTSGVKIA
jgi:hypothetical protein